MGWVETAHGRMGMIEQGSGGGPLVLLHGVGADKSGWRPQLEHFGGSRRTLAFDYPGYGESDPLALSSRASGVSKGECFDTETSSPTQHERVRDNFANAILAAMDALDIEQAHICGLSLGGVVALAMHAAAPERCASLILADSFAAHPDGQAIHDRSVAAVTELGMRGLAEARVDSLLGSRAPAEVRAEVIATMSRIDPAAYALGAAAVWLADQRERAAAVRCPTLILCGSEDRLTPPHLSEQLKDLIPHAALVEIAGAGHLSNLEQPVIFNRVVEGFLAGIE